MRVKTHIPFLLGLAGLMASLLAPLTSHAQPAAFSLTTSPLPINLKTTPGKAVSTDLRVKNNAPTTQKLKVNLYKFSVNAQNEVTLAEAAPEDKFMEWVSFNPSTFDAAPNEWRTVKMTINVPADAALGYYYAVGFAPANVPKPTPGAATLQGQVISFVLLDVDVPGAKRSLTVTSFKSNKGTYEFLPASFTVTIKNTGNIHLVPTGDIFINRGDKTVATIPINPGQSNILPNSSRSFTVEWKDGFPAYTPKLKSDGNPVINPKTNAIETELKWDFESPLSKFRIGPYSAKMLLVYDDGQRDVPIEGKLSFWLMPWRIIGAFVLLLIALSFFVYRYRRLRKRLKAYQKNESKPSKDAEA